MSLVTFLVALPPPIHGMSNVNHLMLEDMLEHAKVRTFNLSPSFATRLFPGPSWKLVRAVYLLLFLLPLFSIHSALSASKTLYFSVSGGSGQWLELPFILIASFFYKRIYVHHHSFAYCQQYKLSADCLHKIGRGKITHIVLCEQMAELICENYLINPTDIRVLNNVAFLRAETCKIIERKRIRQVGFIGNITREKGIVEFLEVCRNLRDPHSALSFVIAGPCPDKSILALIQNACLEFPEVKYVGPVYGDEKASFFRSIDVLLFPSSYPNEAQPLTILEAFLAGVPVIAWARGCVDEMMRIGAGEAIGIEYPFNQSCVATLNRWLRNPEIYRKITSSLQDRLLLCQRSELIKLESLIAEIRSDP